MTSERDYLHILHYKPFILETALQSYCWVQKFNNTGYTPEIFFPMSYMFLGFSHISLIAFRKLSIAISSETYSLYCFYKKSFLYKFIGSCSYK